MNKNIKIVLLVAGIILLAYGFYTLVIPETKVAIGDVNIIESQNNKKAYITIGLGILAVVLSLIKGKS